MRQLSVVRVGDAHARSAVEQEVEAEASPAEEEHGRKHAHRVVEREEEQACHGARAGLLLSSRGAARERKRERVRACAAAHVPRPSTPTCGPWRRVSASVCPTPASGVGRWCGPVWFGGKALAGARTPENGIRLAPGSFAKAGRGLRSGFEVVSSCAKTSLYCSWYV